MQNETIMLIVGTFIAGIIFIVLVLPIIQSIVDTISILFQWIVSAVSVRVTKNNIKIQDLNDSIEPTSAQAIGFQDSDDYYDYDEDDTDNKLKKVGF